MSAHTAIIVEPRKHRALQFVVQNALENISNEWSVIIFHGSDNIDYTNDIITSLSQYSCRLSKIMLNVSNLTPHEYSKLLASKDFYAHIPTEMFLIFQTDSLIFSTNKDKIYKFMDYDYVGSPCWGGNVQNGGLSLRRKSKMLQIIESKPYKGEAEDIYFSYQTDAKKPTEIEAREFGVEHQFHPAPFGCHQGYRFHSQLCDIYPDLAILRDLQAPAPPSHSAKPPALAT